MRTGLLVKGQSQGNWPPTLQGLRQLHQVGILKVVDPKAPAPNSGAPRLPR